MSSKYALIGLALLLTACGSLPRGAGLQSEVLSQPDATVHADGTVTGSEFAVEPITRDSLARYAGWPAVGEKGLAWMGRVDQPNTRIIAPGDTVALTVWNTEENGLLTRSGEREVSLPPMQVSSSGKIFLPYVGQIRISGMSPDHAREAAETAYRAVMPSAQVQLSLTEGRQNTVSLVGGVAKPGAYPLADQDVTLLDMLAQSGGVDPDLTNPQIRLQRGDRTFGISVGRLLEDTALNTTLRGGDRIHVESDERYFLSQGATGRRAQNPFPQDRVSALDALSIIGGLSDNQANAKGILILRTYPPGAVRADGSGPRHNRTIFTLDLTTADGLFSAGAFDIRSGDLVYVTQSPLIGTRNIFGLIGSVFGLVNQASGN